jgi:ABC-type transporter Mla MlaB component
MLEVDVAAGSVTETVVRLAGAVDRSTADRYRADLHALLVRVPRLVIDVSRVTDLDPAGTGMLMGLVYYAGVCEHELVIDGAPQQLRSLLDVSHGVPSPLP